MAAPMAITRRFHTHFLQTNKTLWKLRSRTEIQDGFLLRNLSSRSFGAWRQSLVGWRRVTFGGLCLGVSSAYVSHLWGRAQHTIAAASEPLPSFTPIRSIRNEQDASGLKLTLFQYETCPFCCKVRAYLDSRGFSYDVVEVNSVRRKETKWSKYKKVPILLCRGQGEHGFLQLNDSSVIISALETYLVDSSQSLDKITSYYPSIEAKNSRGKTVLEFPNKYFVMYGEKDTASIETTTQQRKEERKWRSWTDDVLVHMLSPNVYRSPGEALEAFNYFSEVGEWQKVFSTPERLCVVYVGAAVMFVIGKMLKKKYKLKDDVRESLYDSARQWTKAVGKDRKFMGGDLPNLADLAVYGVLCSIEGCSTFNDLLNHSEIERWYYNTKAVLQKTSGHRVS